MGFDEAMRGAALAAESAVRRAMKKYRDGLVTDEDDLTGVLVGNLDTEFSKSIGGLKWSSSIVRHRKGTASEEQRIGADLIIHVSIKTSVQTYSKGVLVQAKRIEPKTLMTKQGHDELVRQCNKMQTITPASFVFDYAQKSMRCGSASKIAGSSNRELYAACNWTSYRFFENYSDVQLVIHDLQVQKSHRCRSH